jgi:hypothetical protein
MTGVWQPRQEIHFVGRIPASGLGIGSRVWKERRMYSSQLVLEIDAAAAARQVRLLPSPVWRILRLFDGHRTLIQAIDDSPMERAVTLAVVRRLTELGLVREAARAVGPQRETRKLSAEAQAWVTARKRIQQRPQPALQDDDDGLEAALDGLLAELDADAETAVATPNIEGVPEATEHPLSDALQIAIQGPEWPAAELIESLELAEKVRRRLEQVHEIADVPHGPMMLLDTPDIGFSNLELDFFNSYVPELPDDDDFMDLVVEAAQRHG